jgi:hypothetical protein
MNAVVGDSEGVGSSLQSVPRRHAEVLATMFDLPYTEVQPHQSLIAQPGPSLCECVPLGPDRIGVTLSKALSGMSQPCEERLWFHAY